LLAIFFRKKLAVFVGGLDFVIFFDAVNDSLKLISPLVTSPGVRRHIADKLACSNQRRKSAPKALIYSLLSCKHFSLEFSVLPMGSKKVNAEFRRQGLLQAF